MLESTRAYFSTEVIIGASLPCPGKIEDQMEE